MGTLTSPAVSAAGNVSVCPRDTAPTRHPLVCRICRADDSAFRAQRVVGDQDEREFSNRHDVPYRGQHGLQCTRGSGSLRCLAGAAILGRAAGVDRNDCDRDLWASSDGQVIVASDCVTALRIPALLQTGSHAGGCAPAQPARH